MFCHIIHLAVHAECKPFQQAGFRRREVGVADAHGLEAELMRPDAYSCGERRMIDRLRNPVLSQFRISILHSRDDSRITLHLPDEDATLALAQRLAAQLRPGMVIYLHGDLGAGKTTLVRGVLNALGHAGRVKSPTYTLIEPYRAAGLDLCHFDLYRLDDEQEWEAAGFRDEFDGRNIFLVEWPEKAQGLLPQADMEIALEILPHGRNAEIHANTELGRQCIKQL